MTRALALLPLLAGCAISRGVAPLQVGEMAIVGSIGGPLVDNGVPMPLPIASVGVARGLTARTTGHAGLYVTNLVLFGVFGADVGVFTEVLAADGARPRVTLDGTLLFFAGDNAPGGASGGTRLFEDVTALAVWDLGSRAHHVWVGVDSMVQLFPEPHWLPAPVVGGELAVTRHVGLQLEAKWPGFWHNTDVGFITYYAPAQLGAIVVHAGVRARFGGPK